MQYMQFLIITTMKKHVLHNIKASFELISQPLMLMFVFDMLYNAISYILINTVLITLLTLCIIIVFTLIWNFTVLSKYIPCHHNTLEHTQTRSTYLFSMFLFILHFMLDSAMDTHSTEITHTSAVALHRLSDIFIALFFIQQASHYHRYGVLIVILLMFTSYILSNYMMQYLSHFTILEPLQIIISIILSFFMCMFLHPVHFIKHNNNDNTCC